MKVSPVRRWLTLGVSTAALVTAAPALAQTQSTGAGPAGRPGAGRGRPWNLGPAVLRHHQRRAGGRRAHRGERSAAGQPGRQPDRGAGRHRRAARELDPGHARRRVRLLRRHAEGQAARRRREPGPLRPQRELFARQLRRLQLLHPRHRHQARVEHGRSGRQLQRQRASGRRQPPGRRGLLRRGARGGAARAAGHAVRPHRHRRRRERGHRQADRHPRRLGDGRVRQLRLQEGHRLHQRAGQRLFRLPPRRRLHRPRRLRAEPQHRRLGGRAPAALLPRDLPVEVQRQVQGEPDLRTLQREGRQEPRRQAALHQGPGPDQRRRRAARTRTTRASPARAARPATPIPTRPSAR